MILFKPGLTVDAVKRRLEREATLLIRTYRLYLLILKVFFFEKPQTSIDRIWIIKDSPVF
jgi:hypothetical protein